MVIERINKKLFFALGLYFMIVITANAGTYAGLVPGTSLKKDADRVFGIPIREVQQGIRYDYDAEAHDARRLSVTFDPGTQAIETINIYFKQEYPRSQLAEWFDLKSHPEKEINSKGNLVERYLDKGIALHYRGTENSTQVQFLSFFVASIIQKRPEVEMLTDEELIAQQEQNESSAKEAFQKGEESLKKNDFDAAIGFFKVAALLDNSQAFYHSSLGRAYYESGNTRGAVYSFEHAISLKPSFYSYYMLGMINWENGRFDHAIAPLREAIRLRGTDTKDMVADILLGECYFRTDMVDDSLDIFLRLYKQNKRTPDPLVIYYLAASFDRTNNARDAMYFYKKYLSMKHDNSKMNAVARSRLQALRNASKSSKDVGDGFLRIFDAVTQEMQEFNK